ncbi:MAG: exodeoxyribonuclease VII large subunit [Oscillospiraceae bacterium]|nr:exodeoxyribonuclease VII large subunit [Oscillospiraceae bacterium]
MSNKFIATVSQVNRRAALTLGKDTALSGLFVKGEVSNFVCHYKTGHLYFTLKDESSALKCVMFAGDAARLNFMPENGQIVIASGKVGIYERDGAYQLYANSLEPETVESDTDSLYALFLKLKEKLQTEGIFANCRPLPVYPKKICLITSKDGAALQDILSVFARRYPVLQVDIIPVLVQGAGAAKSLVAAVKSAQGLDCDVIIIARGGGAAEDLQAFNDEQLAREIFASRTPVVSAIGHETDFTIADFAADLRAPTPSAAAEITTPDLAEIVPSLLQTLAGFRRRVFGILDKKQARLDYTRRRITAQMKNLIALKKQKLQAAETLIHALNPDKIFARGFAAVFDKSGRAVKNSGAVEVGDELNIRLSQGEITAIVKQCKMQNAECRNE